MQLTKYILKRLFWLVITLFIVVVITFFMMRVMPGSPFNNPKLTPQALASLNTAYGLDKPLFDQLILYLQHTLTGNFGTSFVSTNQSVATMIAQRLPVSAQLGLQAMIIGLVVGIWLGITSARHKNGVLDAIFSFVSTLSISVPSYVVASMLLLYFGYTWQILPVIGWTGMFTPESWMPSIALGFSVIGTIARFVRAEMVESLTSDYITLARAKGLSDTEVVYKHALRNSLIPVLTLVGPMMANLLTGSILIENIFSIPGIGYQFVSSVAAKDYPVVMATTIVYGAMLMGFILITDILTAFIDPRVRLQ